MQKVTPSTADLETGQPTGLSQGPQLVLMLVCLGTIGVLLKSLIAPASAQRAALPAIANPASINRSQLEKAGLTLVLEEINAFSANSRRFQRDLAIARSSSASSQQIRRELGIGSYLLSRDRTHTRLTACLTPQAKSIGSYEDYLRHSHSQPFKPGQLATWALGLGPVRDARCLWVTLSIPMDQSRREAEQEALLKEAFRTVLDSV